MNVFGFKPVGTVHSPFREKFAIPRQAGLVTEARGSIELLPPFNQRETVRGLDGFSHIWLLFMFHASLRERWKATVRPPRLGGNERMGIFATRAPYRPNPIGQSALRLERIDCDNGQVRLQVSGIDLLDQTPVLDIKPYLPWADCIQDASGGYAKTPPERTLNVVFSSRADAQCQALDASLPVNPRRLIEQLLRNDPRPAYRERKPGKHDYGFRLYDFDVKCQITDDTVHVLALESSSSV